MADQDFNIKVVTTADTSGLRQTSISMAELQKQIQAQNIAARQMGYQLGQALRVVAGGAIIAGGYKFVSALHEAASEIDKISASLNKQGEQLVENSQKFAEMSRFAESNADIIKIGEGALKGVETAHKTLLDTAAKELTTWQKIQDVWTSGFDVFGRGVARPQADALKLAQSIAAQNLEIAKQNAIYDISAARINQARRASQTYEETVKELTDAIAAEQAKVTPENLLKDVEGYLKAAAAVETLTKQLEAFKKQQAQIASSPASNQLQKEAATPSTTADRLKQQQTELNKAAQRTDLTPAEQSKLRDAQVATEKALRDSQIEAQRKDREGGAISPDVRRRYEGGDLPTPQAGQSQASVNQALLTAINKLITIFQ